MKKLFGYALAAILVASAVPGAAHARSAQKARRLHVEVNEKGGDSVSITVPISMARAALAIAGESRITIEDDDVKVAELRAAWKELKESGEPVKIEAKDGDDDIRITNERGAVRIAVRDRASGASTVDVTVPESAVDALLSGDDASLDLGAALGAIQEGFIGDLVTVDDGGDHVRIWVE